MPMYCSLEEEPRKARKSGDAKPAVRPLYRLTLAESEVQEDDDQSVRLVKRTQSHRHRDDLAKALTLAAGLLARLPAPRPVEVLVANPT